MQAAEMRSPESAPAPAGAPQLVLFVPPPEIKKTASLTARLNTVRGGHRTAGREQRRVRRTPATLTRKAIQLPI